MFVEGCLEPLTEAECWGLLATGSVGRVGVTLGALPAIIPVNYALVGEAVAFWTSAGTKLARATDGNVVAFEVGRHEGRPGDWSVLTVGRAEVMDAADERYPAYAAALGPYVRTARTGVVRLIPELVSGRRVIAAAALLGGQAERDAPHER